MGGIVRNSCKPRQQSTAAARTGRCGLLVVLMISLAGGCNGQPRNDSPSPGSSDDKTQIASRTPSPEQLPSNEKSATMPDWARGAVFYQLFPERFRNGDPSNDPTRESLEFPENVTDKWEISPWTGDWYARAEWEKVRGEDFYEQGVFDRRYGGDLAGVLDKLEYLKQLGVEVIYFNPVFYAKSLHKYDGNTYHHIDPHFGPDPEGDLKIMNQETSDPTTWHWTAADKLMLKLIEEAHALDMRIVVDGVFNHTGRDFFAFADLRKNQADSPYRDWYIVQSFDDPATPQNEFSYKGWWGVDTLPEFADNQARDNLHPGPKKYIFDATRRWMDPNGDGDPRDGIDGWRLDVAVEVPNGFWREWHKVVRDINPEAYTVAEHWQDAAEYLADCGFSSTMNYHGFAYPVKGYLIDGTLSPSDFASMVTERGASFDRPTQEGLLSLIDSHDTDRVASMIVNRPDGRPYVNPDRFDYDIGERASARHWDQYDVRKPNDEERRIQRMVALMQITYPGAPMFYYGTECGMWGGDDPDDRMPMYWQDLAPYDPQAADPLGRERTPDPVELDEQLWKFYQSTMWLRHQLEELKTGSFEVVETDDQAQALVFKRSGDRRDVYVFFNRGSEPYQFEHKLGVGQVFETFTASGEPDKVKVRHEDGVLKVEMPALEAVVVLHRRDLQ